MTEERIQYKRGRPYKRVLPHHTNTGCEEIQPRDIKICTTFMQIEMHSLKMKSLVDTEEKEYIPKE